MKKISLVILTVIVGLTACEKKTDCDKCIDPSLMGGSYIEIYDPVCGCDDNTYSNSAHAMSEGGVTSWTDGPCEDTHENECVDQTLINKNAVIPPVYRPVCGCDGKTYQNSFAAKAEGVKSYRSGQCEVIVDDCIDSSLIKIDTNIFICEVPYLPLGTDSFATVTATQIDDPTIVICLGPDTRVCGCNGVTYESGYEARNVHGVKSYTPGPCMEVYTW